MVSPGKHPIGPEFVLLLNRVKHVRHFARRTHSGVGIVERNLKQCGKYKGPIKLLRQNMDGVTWLDHAWTAVQAFQRADFQSTLLFHTFHCSMFS